MLVTQATITDLTHLTSIDSKVIGNDSRRAKIKTYIQQQQCILAVHNGIIVGFAYYDTSFFDYCFIQLLMIDPDFRRLGAATALIQYIEKHSPTSKLFTSTNESNTIMQQVCLSQGFVRSGSVENLDDGDPEWIYFKLVR